MSRTTSTTSRPTGVSLRSGGVDPNQVPRGRLSRPWSQRRFGERMNYAGRPEAITPRRP